MNAYAVLFYLLTAVILAASAIAVTRRNMVHAVIYLVVSFFGSALLFYLLGAPLLAALEVIIYAGAIMILFLFIIMMLKVDTFREPMFPLRQLMPAAAICVVYFIVLLYLVFETGRGQPPLHAAAASPAALGHFLFRQHWLAIEIASLLLLAAVIGVLFLGRELRRRNTGPDGGDNP